MGPELETGPITIPRRLGSRRSLNVGQRGDLSYELRLDPMHEVNLRAPRGGFSSEKVRSGSETQLGPEGLRIEGLKIIYFRYLAGAPHRMKLGTVM
jgi:hypothetical protein